MPVQPKKKPTVTDVAIRLFISDMLDRNQIKLARLAPVLGYKDSTELFRFLRGERNYSRKRLASTIDRLASVFNANKVYLETGHGEMYAGGKPYMANENENQFNLADPQNIASYYSRQRIKEMEDIIKKMQEQVDHLEQLLKSKDETIELQKELLAAKKKTRKT